LFKSASVSPPASAPTPARLRILILTKVFPNAAEPLAAAFHRQQFGALARQPGVEVEVVAPVPWFPGAAHTGARTGAGRLHAVPQFEWIEGLFVRHPRVFHLPRIDYAAAAVLYEVCLSPLLRRWRGRFDVVLGAFAYPDGVAAVALARRLGIPAVIAALGSDINVTSQLRGVGGQLGRALARASRVVAVSRDLADRTVALGARPERVSMVPNGVDAALFHVRDRSSARQHLGRGDDRAPWILFVGRLEASKGVLDLLHAWTTVAAARSDAKLVLVGDGSMRAACEQAALVHPGRLLLPGARPLDEVAQWMAAADLVTLPSHAEGTPNVVLEALASGRKVVATRVGGLVDLIDAPVLGQLTAPHDPAALAAALLRGLDDPGDATAIAAAAAARTISWEQSAAELRAVLEAARGEAVARD
jgi:teichuronic acid biosynthesis glycosyltransferase TuaC